MRIDEVLQTIDEGVHDPNIFKAVFMAGSPGSGKTTVSKKLFGGSGLKHLNVDDFYNLLRQAERSTGNVEHDYDAAWKKYEKREQNFLDGRLGLIIDGTGKNPEKMEKVKQKLEELGYETAMVFVNTSLETSIRRAEERARNPNSVDYGRRPDSHFIKDTWEKVQRGLGRLQGAFGERFFIVDNNRGDPNLEYVQKSLNKWLNAPPQSHVAKEWMKNELEAKTKSNLPTSPQSEKTKRDDNATEK